MLFIVNICYTLSILYYLARELGCLAKELHSLNYR